MTQSQPKDQPDQDPTPNASDALETDRTSNDQDEQLLAEQESAAAMNADVPQPPDTPETTEGQPS